MFKEINERLKGKNNEINDSKNYQEDLNMYNNDYKFNNNLNENNKINKLNINNQDNDEIQNSKSDIFKSKSDIFKSNIFISNDNNLDQNQNIIDNQNIINNPNNSSEILSKTFDKNAQYNFSIIFTEQDKIIINLFIDYIHSIILLENRTENLRETIALCDDIILIDIFEKFDQTKNELISKIDFKDICNKEYYLFPTDKQIDLIFKRFDIDNDEHFNIQEFMSIICPLKKEYLKLFIKEENNKNTTNSISFESKKKLIDLFKTIINNESFIYELKSNLISQKDFNFIDLWGLLMKFSNDNQTLTKNEFNNFLINFECFLTHYELDIIFGIFTKRKNVMKYDDLYEEIII